MNTVKLKGQDIKLNGNFPEPGSLAYNFTAVTKDLEVVKLSDFKGKKVIMNIFPSIDTPTCAMSVRKFNQEAAGLDDTVVLCLSLDLPFAHQRFCGAEGIDNVVSASLFREKEFAQKYGIEIAEGPLTGLTARSVIVIDTTGRIIYTELVKEIADEPNYDNALKALLIAS